MSVTNKVQVFLRKNFIKKRKFYDSLLRDDEANRLIFNSIKKGEPKSIARIGNTESILSYNYRLNRDFKIPIFSYLEKKALSLSGIYPCTRANTLEFCRLFDAYVNQVDVLSVWFTPGEVGFYRCSNKPQLIPLKTLEPFHVTTPWTHAFEGKKVLVIHPFMKSIQHQIEKSRSYFKNSLFKPKMDLILYKPVQSLGTKQKLDGSWKASLDRMISEIKLIDFDVSLIAAGAYGLPLAVEIKKMGKVGINVGGALQLFFGVMGNRWQFDSDLNKVILKENWIRPLKEDIVDDFTSIEGGCYW